jgi:hypothetical protein
MYCGVGGSMSSQMRVADGYEVAKSSKILMSASITAVG